MIIVTGGFGFIGSQVVRMLNTMGRTDIIIVDDFNTNPNKFKNLIGCNFTDYIHKDQFLARLSMIPNVDSVIHLGACTDTLHPDSNYIIDQNFTFSKYLFNYCYDHKISFIYASSASVYGNSDTFSEDSQYEKPINTYGFSKLMFDNYIRTKTNNFSIPFRAQVVGLRFFNVYGPNEAHKQNMASIIFQFRNQLKMTEKITIFANSDNYARDFIHVNDVINVISHFFMSPKINGIYNCGSGQSRTIRFVVQSIIDHYEYGDIVYKDMPHTIREAYQRYTQADLTKLRKSGAYEMDFIAPDIGIKHYLQYLDMTDT